MQRSDIKIQLIAISCLLINTIFTACSSTDCPLNNTVYSQYIVYDETGKSTLHDSLTISSSRQNKGDTILINRGIDLKSFSLPMGLANNEDTLYFKITKEKSGSTTDTVWIKKDNYPQFISTDCNTTFFHKITAVRHTSHAIQTIHVNNPNVTNDASAEHFYIYFKSNR